LLKRPGKVVVYIDLDDEQSALVSKARWNGRESLVPATSEEIDFKK